jgi:NAD+ synthase (glutamine-hydrolysing)
VRSLRVGLFQINAVVGDLEGNTEKIRHHLKSSVDRKLDIAAFPELAITGYPPEDLLLKPTFLARNQKALSELTAIAPATLVIVGFVEQADDIYNAAAMLYGGRVVGIQRKQYLPNYGVFDENRYFQSGASNTIVRFRNATIGVNICEDIWYPKGPLYHQTLDGDAEVIINLSASPFHAGKREVRESMLKTRAADNGAYIVYTNLVGGQDELVFDGQSLVIGPEGEIESRGRAFQEDVVVTEIDVDRVFGVRLHDPRRRKEKLTRLYGGDWGSIPMTKVDLDAESSPVAPEPPRPLVRGAVTQLLSPVEEIYEALVMGVRDYVGKNGLSDVLIGISGGIDSALVASVACDALGAGHVHGLFMPSVYTSEISGEDAHRLASSLGFDLETVPITPFCDGFLSALSPLFRGKGPDTTEENIQPRVRGILLMALSNKFNYLVLATGNKSEMSVGYMTLYGDMAGGFAVLKDVPKTIVYQLCQLKNTKNPGAIPDRIVLRKPTAELKENQFDTDSLPPYDILDPIMEAYVEEDLGYDEIVGRGFAPGDVARVLRLIDRSEYKRRQSPPGVKISMRAFGKDWRLPMTNRFKGI